MEVMLAPGLDVPINYTEIDVSPAGALWVGRIHNPTGLHPVNTTSKLHSLVDVYFWNATGKV